MRMEIFKYVGDWEGVLLVDPINYGRCRRLLGFRKKLNSLILEYKENRIKRIDML